MLQAAEIVIKGGNLRVVRAEDAFGERQRPAVRLLGLLESAEILADDTEVIEQAREFERSGRFGFFSERQGVTIGGCRESVLAALIECVCGAAQSGYPGPGLRGHFLDS